MKTLLLKDNHGEIIMTVKTDGDWIAMGDWLMLGIDEDTSEAIRIPVRVMRIVEESATTKGVTGDKSSVAA